MLEFPASTGKCGLFLDLSIITVWLGGWRGGRVAGWGGGWWVPASGGGGVRGVGWVGLVGWTTLGRKQVTARERREERGERRE